MILTVTLNPSIDTAYRVERLKVDDVNRVVPKKTAGGKGLNVARVLAQLGDDVLACGLAGGHMGAYVRDLLDGDGIPHDLTQIAGETRVCVSILHEGCQTELLERGPEVDGGELEAFMRRFSELVARADCVTISGSLPRGVDAGCYAELVRLAAEAGVPALLDSSGEPLAWALEASIKPTLIKPNLTEVNDLLGLACTADDLAGLERAVAGDARLAGIPWVVVTLGAAGAAAFHEGEAWRVTMPRIEARNATGSGDATIAGFAHAMAEGADDAEMLRVGMTCGTLNAMDERTGHLAMERWDEVYSGAVVERA